VVNLDVELLKYFQLGCRHLPSAKRLRTLPRRLEEQTEHLLTLGRDELHRLPGQVWVGGALMLPDRCLAGSTTNVLTVHPTAHALQTCLCSVLSRGLLQTLSGSTRLRRVQRLRD